MKPISGYDGQTRLTSSATRTTTQGRTAARHGRTTPTASSSSSTPTSTTSTTRSQRDYDDSYATASPKVFREYSVNASKRKYLQVELRRRDVLHHHEPHPAAVRRRSRPQGDELGHGPERPRRAWGGPVSGVVAEHIIPNSMLANRLDGFHPFKTPGNRGSVAKAKAEMRKSKYANSGGVCTARSARTCCWSPTSGPWTS